MPGEPAPSGAALARMTGYSTLTCRKALGRLIKDGVLVPGTSPGARPRVPPHAPTRGERTLAAAARALSSALAARRRTAGLTQPQLAEIAGMSVTAIGHAETGRLWQSRRFWEHVDKGVGAGGELLALHDAYRATVTGGPAGELDPPSISHVTEAVRTPVSIMIVWSDGAVTGVLIGRGTEPRVPLRWSVDAPPPPTGRAGKLPRSLLRHGKRGERRADLHRPEAGSPGLRLGREARGLMGRPETVRHVRERPEEPG